MTGTIVWWGNNLTGSLGNSYDLPIYSTLPPKLFWVFTVN